MGHCVYKPTIKKGSEMVESKLFNDLLSITKDREATKSLWALSKLKEFTNKFPELKFDENGEVTVESLSKVINISDLLDTNFLVEKRELKAVDAKNNPIHYKESQEIVSRVIEFNNKEGKALADVSGTRGSYTINVVPNTVSSANNAENLMFSSNLNNKLRDIINTLGFEVAVEDIGYNGIFNPLSGEKTAEGLKVVIKVAKGIEGEAAFPEEFSHLMISGLKNEPLVKRILDLVDKEGMVEKILGDSFQEYNELYEGDRNRLVEEAAGKLLFNEITKQNNIIKSNLFSRLWNFAKNKFASLNISTIDKAMEEARREVSKLKTVLDDDIEPLFDKELVLNSAPLYQINKEVKTMKDIADKALETAAMRYNILRATAKDSLSSEEKAHIKELQQAVNNKKYAFACSSFLENTLNEISILKDNLDTLSKSKSSNIPFADLRTAASTMTKIKTFKEGYAPIIATMSTLESMTKRGEVDLDMEDATSLKNLAMDITEVINDINGIYKKVRFKMLYHFFKEFWSGDKLDKMSKSKEGIMTLELILSEAAKDINFADRLWASMTDSSDPLLSLIGVAVKRSEDARDRELREIIFKIRNINDRLVSAGHTTEFMLEKDSKGNKTGRLISNIDFIKFYEDKIKYIDQQKKDLEAKGIEGEELAMRINLEAEQWELNNTKGVRNFLDTKFESIPDPAKYSSKELDRIAPPKSPQREYYDSMMKLKDMLDNVLPHGRTSTYNAIQIMDKPVEQAMESKGNLKKVWGIITTSVEDTLTIRQDTTDFGEGIGIGVETITDFAGNELKRVPVRYVRKLEDMNRLSTDFSSSMMAYADMALNFAAMNEIVDIMELARDHVRDERGIKPLSGNNQLVSTFTVLGQTFSKVLTKSGNGSNTLDKLDDFYESVLYGKRKKNEGTINVFGKELKINGKGISKRATADSLKSLSSHIGMDLNVFAGVANIGMGKIQMMIDGVAGEYYNLKDLAVAELQYETHLPAFLAELESTNKKSKLGLLMDLYDPQGDFADKAKDTAFYKSIAARILSGVNVMFIAKSGEHYLHAKNMLAILNTTKLKDKNGKTITTFKASKVITPEGGMNGVLVFENGTTTDKGMKLFDENMYTELKKLQSKEMLTISETARFEELRKIQSDTDTYLFKLKLKIQKVSKLLNGAHNATDKGAIHRYALGSLGMIFRQWMPAHFSRRYGVRRFDAELDQFREGYYLTMMRFSWGIMKDLTKAKFHLATNWAALEDYEKANIKRAFTELGILGGLAVLIALMGSESDHEGVWHERMLIYQLKRLQLETSASVIFSPNMISNLMTIMKSPSASINTLDGLVGLFNIPSMFDEIQNGRYKGMSVYSKNLLQLTPMLNNLNKIKDLNNEDYMFKIFN